jgi:hypothetical protein
VTRPRCLSWCGRRTRTRWTRLPTPPTRCGAPSFAYPPTGRGPASAPRWRASRCAPHRRHSRARKRPARQAKRARASSEAARVTSVTKSLFHHRRLVKPRHCLVRSHVGAGLLVPRQVKLFRWPAFGFKQVPPHPASPHTPHPASSHTPNLASPHTRRPPTQLASPHTRRPPTPGVPRHGWRPHTAGVTPLPQLRPGPHARGPASARHARLGGLGGSGASGRGPRRWAGRALHHGPLRRRVPGLS